LIRLEEITPMRVIRFATIALGLAVVVTGCGKPTADVAAATAAVDRANTERAGQYAAESLRAAEDARAALDAEVKAQEGKWVKSYGKTRELAAATQAAGDKAAADAIAGREKAEAVTATRTAHVATARAKARIAPVRIGGQIRSPTKVKDVQPVYPAIAQSARVAGLVTIEATIGADGKVSDAKVVRSVPLLDQAALDAVRQWEYAPTLLNGVPVPVVVTVSVNFTRS
jgi:TonB family protein